MTTQYKITAPVALFSGTVAGVVFSQGQALLTVDTETSPAEGATSLPQPRRALTYFQRKGYTVEEVKSAEDAMLDKDTAAPGTPASSAVDPATVAGSGVQAPTPAPTPVGSEELAAQNDSGTPKPPAKSASKSDWVAYAKTVAEDSDEAKAIDSMTRDELAAKYSKEDAK